MLICGVLGKVNYRKWQSQSLIGIVTLLAVTGGCSNNVKVECGGEETIAAVEDMIQKELEKSVRKQLDSEGSVEGYDSAKLRTGTKKIEVKLEEVRTVRDDPDSSRQFCSARIMLKIPDNVVDAADSTRALAELDSVKTLANQHHVERMGEKYGMEWNTASSPQTTVKSLSLKWMVIRRSLPF
jgi:hypothetical protein